MYLKVVHRFHRFMTEFPLSNFIGVYYFDLHPWVILKVHLTLFFSYL